MPVSLDTLGYGLAVCSSGINPAYGDLESLWGYRVVVFQKNRCFKRAYIISFALHRDILTTNQTEGN
jgi:hypothetical protein